MLIFCLMLLFLMLTLHAYREYWRLRNLPQIHRSEFTGGRYLYRYTGSEQ